MGRSCRPEGASRAECRPQRRPPLLSHSRPAACGPCSSSLSKTGRQLLWPGPVRGPWGGAHDQREKRALATASAKPTRAHGAHRDSWWVQMDSLSWASRRPGPAQNACPACPKSRSTTEGRSQWPWQSRLSPEGSWLEAASGCPAAFRKHES